MNDNQALIPKSQLAKYVDDAVQIESAVMTLEKSLESIEAQKEELEEEKDTAISNAYANMNKQIQLTELRQFQKKPAKPTNDPHLGGIIGACFGLYMAFILALAIVASIIRSTFDIKISFNENLATLIFGFGQVLFPPIIGYVIYKLRMPGYTRAMEKWNRECAEIDRINEGIRARFEPSIRAEYEAEKERLEAEFAEKCAVLDAQSLELKRKMVEMLSIRKQFYSIGIIPPDYRSLDCSIVLNQIFRNDLADTMRDAVLLYEDRAYRGIVIKGLSNILSAVSSLSADMQLVVQQVESIERNVGMMSNDLYNICESMDSLRRDTAKTNEELVRESRATRYATEQVAESTRRLQQYAEN